MRTVYLYIFLSLLAISSLAQNISTFAVGMYCPEGGAFDKQGNCYVPSTLGHRIFKIDTLGVITVIAGTGTPGYNGDGGLADTSELNEPGFLALDSAGDIYFCDGANFRIRKIEIATGIIKTIAGTGTRGFSGDGRPAIAAQFDMPCAIAFDNLGNLFIGDGNNNRIRKIDRTGIVATYAGNGMVGSNGDGGPATSAAIGGIGQFAIDDFNNLFIPENGAIGNHIRRVDTAGIISNFAGTGSYNYNGDSISALSANIGAYEVQFDKNGVLYLDDAYHNLVRKVVGGVIYTVAGNLADAYAGDGEAAVKASLNRPSGIMFDNCNNLYITEVNGARIRKVTLDSLCGRSSPPDTGFHTGIGNLSNIDIKIYPNPTISDLHVDNILSTSNYSIIDITGRKMLSGKLVTKNNNINVNNLLPGIYFIEIKDANKRDTKEKIIIR